MIKTSFLNPQKLPLVIETDASDKSLTKLINLVFDWQKFLREQLLQSGALLFRGFKIENTGEFETFVKHFSGKEFFNYAGGVSPRLSLGGGVYTSTEYPPDLMLALHNELSYSQSYPQHLYFFCAVAPEIGGATTLGDSRKILQNINPQLVKLFKDKKIRYDRNLQADKSSGYSWQAAFETDEKPLVEKVCQTIGASFEWKPDGSLRVSQIQPATAIHSETGEEVWFNQADGFHPSNLDLETQNIVRANNEGFRLNSFFGDGAPLLIEHLEHIRSVLKNATVPHRWQPSDILVLDNLLTAHGRMPFLGTRKIALAMT